MEWRPERPCRFSDISRAAASAAGAADREGFDPPPALAGKETEAAQRP